MPSMPIVPCRFGMVRSILMVVCAVLMFGSLSRADDLTGRVLDPQGVPVSNVQLRLFDRKSGELRKTTSSAEGIYAFPGIPSGDYLLEGDASSAALTASRETSVDGDQTLDLELQISATNVEILVTASGTPLSIEEIAKAMDVVDSAQIERRGEISITEAIRNLPGLRIQTLEGPGSFTTINVRGLRAPDTAVLIDGMRFRDTTSPQGDATAFLSNMSTVDTERIELLRGSGSSLYGSNAVGGVININSRPGGGPTHGQFLAEGGSLGAIRSVISIGGGLASDRLTYSGGASHLNITKGVRDGLPYRNTSTRGSVKYTFTPGLSLTGRLWYADSYLASTENPTYTPAMLANASGTPIKAIALPKDQLELFEQNLPYSVGNATFIPNQIDRDARLPSSFLSGGVTLQHQVSPMTSYHAIYQGVNTRRQSLDGSAGAGFEPDFNGSYRGHTDTIQLRLNQQAGDYNLLSFGYEFEREEYLSFGAQRGQNEIEIRQRSNAFYVQDQIRLAGGQLQMTVGGRIQSFGLDDPTYTGLTSPYRGVSALEPPTAYTGDGSVAYFIRQTGTKIRSHVGNSFRAPSGYERFGGGFGSYYGDPRLSPDRSIAVDGGIDQWLLDSKVQLSATAFYTKLQETIRFGSFPAATDPFGRTFGGYVNGGGGIARGVEFSGRISPTSRTNLDASYTYVNSDSRTPTVEPNYFKVLGLSTHTFTLTATQWIGSSVNVAFDLSALSDYVMTLFGTDFSSRPFLFNGPTKADVVFHYDHPLANDRSLDLYVKIENIFNQQPYEDGFIGPKAWAVAGFRYKY